MLLMATFWGGSLGVKLFYKISRIWGDSDIFIEKLCNIYRLIKIKNKIRYFTLTTPLKEHRDFKFPAFTTQISSFYLQINLMYSLYSPPFENCLVSLESHWYHWMQLTLGFSFRRYHSEGIWKEKSQTTRSIPVKRWEQSCVDNTHLGNVFKMSYGYIN